MTGTPEPRLTIILPCHDDGALFLEAIRSVDEPEPVEIAVVDDGSTDVGTKEALDQVAEEGVKVIRLEDNRGPAVARSAGLEAAGGEYVFPLDADDLALPGALSAMAERLEATPEAEVCFGDYSRSSARTSPCGRWASSWTPIGSPTGTISGPRCFAGRSSRRWVAGRPRAVRRSATRIGICG